MDQDFTLLGPSGTKNNPVFNGNMKIIGGDAYTQVEDDGTGGTKVATVDDIVKPITVQLDTVTNTSGSYTHTTQTNYVVASMKPIQIECSNPSAFQDDITVTTANGSITLSCSSVSGTSDVTVTLMKSVLDGEADPEALNPSEFDVLAGRIGNLSSLTTTEKNSVVGAVNEVNDKINTSYRIATGVTVSDLVTALNSFHSSMNNGEVRNISFIIGTASEPFSAVDYYGTIRRISSSYSVISVQPNSKVGVFITGRRASSGTWSWESLSGKLETKTSTNFASLKYREINNIVEIVGTFTGNGNATIDLGIVTCTGVILTRNTNNGKLEMQYMHGGIIDTWDGIGGRIFDNNVMYYINGILTKD